MTQDYQVGGLSHNAFDIDADGLFLYLAVLNGSDLPQILKMKADLSEDATEVFDPGAGTTINLMAGDLSAYWVWAVGNFGAGYKITLTEDGGGYWTNMKPGQAGTCTALQVGPGDDQILTTSVHSLLLQSYWWSDDIFWRRPEIDFTVNAIHRLPNHLIAGDDVGDVHYSPNEGINFDSLGLPANVAITSVIMG